jgi:hypothetical protein
MDSKGMKPLISISFRTLCMALSLGALIGCSAEMKTGCPDPGALTPDQATAAERKLAGFRTGFDPNCK